MDNVNPTKSISDRMSRTVRSFSDLQSDLSNAVKTISEVPDDMANLVRGLEEVADLSAWLTKTQEELVRTAANYRVKLAAGIGHLEENSDVLESLKSQIEDDATLLNQKMQFLYQSFPPATLQSLEHSTEHTIGVAASQTSLEQLTLWQEVINKAIEAKAKLEFVNELGGLLGNGNP